MLLFRNRRRSRRIIFGDSEFLNIGVMAYSKIRGDLIFPDISFKIVGSAFEVFNELGSGHKEKIYQKAMSIQFGSENIPFKEQIYHPLIFKDENLKKNYFDFLVEEKVIVELKRSDYFSRKHFEQLNHYLRISKLQLGLLVSFTSHGVRFKRVVNLP